jgi:hypothetical protein
MPDTPLMLWELSVTEQRYRAVLEVMAGIPVTEVAEQYGVSRQSVHTWLRRYRDEGPPGLEDRSHKVHRHPWQIPAGLEAAMSANYSLAYQFAVPDNRFPRTFPAAYHRYMNGSGPRYTTAPSPLSRASRHPLPASPSSGR